MRNIRLFISLAGKGKVESDWSREKTIHIERLYYINGGHATYPDTDGTPQPFLPGHFYLFPYNCTQEFTCDMRDPLDHLYIDFVSSPLILSRKPLCFPVKDGSPLSHTVALLDSILPVHPKTKDKHLPKELINPLAETVLQLLDREQAIPLSDDRIVNETLSYLHKHYASPCKIEELAASHGYQTDHFIRRFHAVVGKTPYAYLRMYRLYKASLLLAGGVPLSEAAVRVGYESAAGLSRALQKERRENQEENR